MVRCTRGTLTDEQKQQGGSAEGLIRIVVLIADLEDIERDYRRGFPVISQLWPVGAFLISVRK